MDNFIDKLAQKFIAGEVIKANSVAEERELKRLREQVQEYEKCFQEMRKLQMANTQSAGQLQELMKKAEEHFGQLEKESREKLQQWQMSGEENNKDSIEILKRMEEVLGESKQEVNQLLSNIEELQKDLENRFRQSDDYLHKENVKVYRNVQAVVVEEVTKKSEAIIKSQEENGKKYGKPILILAALAFLCAAADLVITLMNLYGIF